MEKMQIAQLVDKVREGDNAAFETLYNETNKGAYFVALKITGNEDDAMDILQDSYVKALDKLSQLKDSATFVSWFNQIVANTAKNYICKLKPVLFNTEEEELASQDWQAEEDADFIPEESMDNSESRKAIMDIIDSLPEDRRLCVLMHYYDDMGTAQIAKTLEISENTVKSHLLLARKSIKKTIEELRRKGATILSAAAIPFFIWMLRRSASACVMSQAKSAALLGLIKGASALLGGAVAAGTAAVVAGTAVKVGIVAKIIAWVTVPKIIATVVGAVVIFGGVTAGIKITKDRNPETTTTEPTGTYYDSSSDDTTLVTDVTGIVYDGYPLPEYSIIDDYSQNPTNDGEDIPVVATTGDSDKVTFGTAPHGTTAANTTKPVSSTTKQNVTTAVQTTAEPVKTVPATTAPATIKPVPTTKPVTTTARPTTTKVTTTRPTTTAQPTTTAPVTTTEPTTAASEFEYTVSGSSATVTGYKGSGGSVTVPSMLGGATVTAIADYAFENNTSITSVSVPSTVTSIGKGAFANCTSLTSVSLPSGLRSLGNTAFKNCTRLSSVNIPSGLSTIPAGAFQGCAALTAVTIQSTVTSIGTNAFQGCPNLTITCPEGSAAQSYATANGINCNIS